MELKRIGIEQKEAIKKLFVSVFTIEVGVYSYWISGFGSAHCMGGFKDLILS